MGTGRPRGRPPKNPQKKGRSRREILTRGRMKLEVREPPGFHYHWINDQDSRLWDAKQLGYVHVTYAEVGGKDAIGDPGIEHETTPDSMVCRRVGTLENGNPMVAYLMKLPIEDYNAAMEEKWEEADIFESQIKSGPDDPHQRLQKAEISRG